MSSRHSANSARSLAVSCAAVLAAEKASSLAAATAASHDAVISRISDWNHASSFADLARSFASSLCTCLVSNSTLESISNLSFFASSRALFDSTVSALNRASVASFFSAVFLIDSFFSFSLFSSALSAVASFVAASALARSVFNLSPRSPCFSSSCLDNCFDLVLDSISRTFLRSSAARAFSSATRWDSSAALTAAAALS